MNGSGILSLSIDLKEGNKEAEEGKYSAAFLVQLTFSFWNPTSGSNYEKTGQKQTKKKVLGWENYGLIKFINLCPWLWHEQHSQKQGWALGSRFNKNWVRVNSKAMPGNKNKHIRLQRIRMMEALNTQSARQLRTFLIGLSLPGTTAPRCEIEKDYFQTPLFAG